MSQVFFLSYAAPDADDAAQRGAIDQFYADLKAKVREKFRERDAEVGFRDSRDLEPGTPDWAADLARALHAHPVGVVLRSPQYLSADRPWCHWECQYLAARNSWADARLQSRPRLLLVIDWIAVRPDDIPVNFPPRVQTVREAIAADNQPGDQEAVRAVANKGLRDMMAEKGADAVLAAHYLRFVRVLADYIVRQWEGWREVERRQLDPPLPPAYDPAQGWRAPTGPTNAGAAPAPRRPMPVRKVYVVYIAAHPDQVDTARAWRYLDDGESDWHAFAGEADDGLPNGPSIGAMVRSIEAEGGLEVVPLLFETFSDPQDDSKAERLRRVKGHPVMFIIDPWTATQIDGYRQALLRCVALEADRLAYTCPLVIWNDQDHAALQRRQDFEDQVAALFNRHHLQEVNAQDDFVPNLLAAVRRLQALINKDRAKALPEGFSPIPRISPNRVEPGALDARGRP